MKVISLKVKYKPGAAESKGVYTFGQTDPWTFDNPTYMDNTAGDEVVADLTNGVTLNNDASLTTKQVNGDANYLMLLPQEVGDGDIELEVTWTVGVVTNNQTIELPPQVWLPDKSYDYELVVSLTAVTLAPVVVNPWDDKMIFAPYTITYEPGSGSGKEVEQQVVTNVAYPLKTCTFTAPEGAPFAGWNTKADGSGEDYREGDSFMRTSDAPVTLYAQWAGVIDLSTTTAPSGVTYNDPVFTINTDGKYTVINSTKEKRIVVTSGKTVTVILSDASIDVSSTDGVCAFDMAGATVTLKLSGNNTLKSGTTKAGLRAPENSNLTINSFPGGALTATGGDGADVIKGAGIGGDGGAGNKIKGDAGGTITINGGTITATGGSSIEGSSGAGAGIGAGGAGDNIEGSDGGTVTINGGKVKATGGNGSLHSSKSYSDSPGAGIGGAGSYYTNPGGAAASYTGPGSSEDTTGATGRYPPRQPPCDSHRWYR